MTGSNRRFGISAFFFFIFVAAFAWTMTAFAQGTTGAIAGRIVDAQGLAVPGVTVTVTGPQGAKNIVTDAEGRFSLPFLTPGTYTVRAELQGFKTVEQADVTVSLGQTVEIPLKMEVGGFTETVQVTGSTPVVDTTTTTTGAVLSSDMLKRVPVGRRISDTLYLAPASAAAAPSGRANPSISGGSGLDNQYVDRRRQRHEPGLRRARLLLDRLRVARQRDAVRLRARKSRSRPAATRRSSASRPAASSTSSPRAAPTSSTGRCSATRGPASSKATGRSSRSPNGTVQTRRLARARRRRRRRRPDHQEPAVLLRRDRPVRARRARSTRRRDFRC